MEEQSKALEAALWTAVRAMMERSARLKRMAEQAKEVGLQRSEGRFLSFANEIDNQAEVIRRSLTNGWKDIELE